MRKKSHRWILLSLQIALLLVMAGCQSAYYATMEAMGHPKREILVDRVEDARTVLKVGDEVEAKFTGLDRKTRIVSLSILCTGLGTSKHGLKSSQSWCLIVTILFRYWLFCRVFHGRSRKTDLMPFQYGSNLISGVNMFTKR